nr:unnamed protein product [Callosobruchus analis]
MNEENHGFLNVSSTLQSGPKVLTGRFSARIEKSRTLSGLGVALMKFTFHSYDSEMPRKGTPSIDEEDESGTEKI